MKKLILTILAGTFLLSCSSDSSNDDSNNPSSTGLLVKTETNSNGTSTYNYNGNKLLNGFTSGGGEPFNFTFTYSGDFIITLNTTAININNISNTAFNYSNNLLSSSTQNIIINNISRTYNKTYTYNSDGSITENIIVNNGSGSNKFIRFYTQGNCVREERYDYLNSVISFTGSITYSYDTNNHPCKNITGFYAIQNPQKASSINNVISETTKNAYGVITKTVQTAYQYNSQNYPVSGTTTTTNYTINPQTGSSTPQTPSVSNITYTYY